MKTKQNYIWIARDQSGLLYAYKEKPEKNTENGEISFYLDCTDWEDKTRNIDKDLFPGVTYKNSPQRLLPEDTILFRELHGERAFKYEAVRLNAQARLRQDIKQSFQKLEEHWKAYTKMKADIAVLVETLRKKIGLKRDERFTYKDVEGFFSYWATEDDEDAKCLRHIIGYEYFDRETEDYEVSQVEIDDFSQLVRGSDDRNKPDYEGIQSTLNAIADIYPELVFLKHKIHDLKEEIYFKTAINVGDFVSYDGWPLGKVKSMSIIPDYPDKSELCFIIETVYKTDSVNFCGCVEVKDFALLQRMKV